MKRPFLGLALTLLAAPVLADSGRLDVPSSPALAARASDVLFSTRILKKTGLRLKES